MRFPKDIRAFARRFVQSGFELYVVGGAVRDRLLGRNSFGDFDFATDATPAQVQQLFRSVIPTGISHGTVTVLFRENRFEVTTYRVDGQYSDGRHPDHVAFTRSLKDDIARRDFTINALAADPLTGEVIDYYAGRQDLKAGVIRSVGLPDDRFQEDSLRMLRAIRFACQLEFAIDPPTRSAISRNAESISQVAVERITQELNKVMSSRTPSLGWRLLDQLHLLEFILPELTEDRRRHLPVEVFPHLLATCDVIPPDQPVLRWAALLHDVAKPECFSDQNGTIHFHGHDVQGAGMAREILERLRMPRTTIDRVERLITEHMFGYSEDWSDAAVRRLIARVGKENIHDLITLRRADTAAKLGALPAGHPLNALHARIDTLLSQQESAFTRSDLAVSGTDLITNLPIRQGPQIGQILEELLEAVLADPQLNKRDTLLSIAERIFRERYPESH